MLKRFFIIILLFSLCISPVYGYKGADYDTYKSGLLGYMIKEHLSVHNFGNKKFDNNLSRNAFKLYIKQLDSQKRFLLKSDINKLKAYADKIDDEIHTGRIELPLTASKILTTRINQVQKIVDDILSRDFDFSIHETIETDPDKLDYCKTLDELKERWRKIIKYEILSNYLILIDDFKKDPVEAMKTAKENVKKGHDEVFSRMLKEKRSDHYNRYFSAVARSFDPHTDYLPPEGKEEFEISMRGSFEGIGAVLREEGGYIKIESIKPGGPAFKQGELEAGDIILKVAQADGDPVDLFGMRVSDAVKLIRGKKGTEVRLTVKKQDASQRVISIIRDIIPIDETFAKSTILKDKSKGKKYGYIKLPAFYRDLTDPAHGGSGRNSTDDVKKELANLLGQNVEGIILDVRHNGGGFLGDAIGIAGLFIESGPIVQIKSARGKITTHNDDDPAIYYKGPLVILVDKTSASASEILAAALQDYGRAVIIGSEHTHGKGTVQMMVNLDEVIPWHNMEKYKPLGGLRLTIQKFYRITGESTQYKGVIPDIILPDRMKNMKIGERYLDYALPWDKIKKVSFKKWSEQPDIKTLKLKSKERVQRNPIFLEIIKDSEKIGEQQKKTTKSLNIDIMRQEKAQLGIDTKGFHGGRRDKKQETPQGKTEDEKRDLWADDLINDPYINEAMNVISDMISGISPLRN